MTSDDVDRLFQCFKCGISPPQSALRERKGSKFKSQEAGSKRLSICSGILSPGSGGDRQETHSVQLGIEEFKSAAVKANGVKQGNPIAPVVFYGSPQGIPPKRPSSLLRLLREIRADLTVQKRLNLRKEIWATFPRQEEAVRFAKDRAHAHMFSYQDHFTGQRRFLVSSYEEFWRRYKNMNSKYRHHYEVIQEGLPCHLYFDLEFSKRLNPAKNGDEMVDILVCIIYEALLEKYSIHGSREWVVELDSSTDEKFSRHVIIRIPQTAFKDNSHVGAFVAEICSRILNERDRDGTCEKLLVSKESSAADCPSHLFVDTAVYSRNRVFRLALSSKAGKNSILLPTGRYKCKAVTEEEMFMESLICNMDLDCEKLLICKMDLDCVKTLEFDTELNLSHGNHSIFRQNFKPGSCTSDISKTFLMGKSPFPSLDSFVESVASVGNVPGKVRSWYWFSEYGLMVYSMSRNRFCERIGRQHKSNHVMYIVDLRRAAYYQKCYDPDCRGYRSPLRPLSVDAIPDSEILVDSEHKNSRGGSAVYNRSSQFVENDQKHALTCNDESIANRCKKDAWWLEGVTVADSNESSQNAQGPISMGGVNAQEKTDEDDESWWAAVEETASQVELSTITGFKPETVSCF